MRAGSLKSTSEFTQRLVGGLWRPVRGLTPVRGSPLNPVVIGLTRHRGELVCLRGLRRVLVSLRSVWSKGESRRLG